MKFYLTGSTTASTTQTYNYDQPSWYIHDSTFIAITTSIKKVVQVNIFNQTNQFTYVNKDTWFIWYSINRTVNNQDLRYDIFGLHASLSTKLAYTNQNHNAGFKLDVSGVPLLG
jgi:hypothetical protein